MNVRNALRRSERLTWGKLLPLGFVLLVVAAATTAWAFHAISPNNAHASTVQASRPYVTFYGWNDNDNGSGTYNVGTIAYTNCGHSQAWEATGTYADPILFAADIQDIGAGKYFQPCSIVYLPSLEKYFILSDQCANCDSQMDGVNASFHIDLWMGPAHTTTPAQALKDCEDAWTQGARYTILNPAQNYQVDTTPLFDGTTNTCATSDHNYADTQNPILSPDPSPSPSPSPSASPSPGASPSPSPTSNPPTLTLLTPANNALLSAPATTLVWGAATGVASYTVLYQVLNGTTCPTQALTAGGPGVQSVSVQNPSPSSIFISQNITVTGLATNNAVVVCWQVQAATSPTMVSSPVWQFTISSTATSG